MATDPHTTPLARFLQIVSQLRNPQSGCPWDVAQNFSTLKPLLIEEVYEVSDAVEKGPDALKEELGDLVSLVGLFAQIATEQQLFSFESILEGISDKLVRRHPHVFGETKLSSAEEVLKNWERIKQDERKSEKKEDKGLLGGVPRSLPSLLKAQQIGERCARIGFDWSSQAGVVEKIREELLEFLHEAPQVTLPTPQGAKPDTTTAQNDRLFEEFGDLLFTLAQYSRHLGFSAEEALQAANAKFMKRFKQLEQLAAIRYPSQSLSSLTPQVLEKLWGEAKRACP